MMGEHSLLINEPFALRQRNGMPVFTEIKTEERPYTEQEIDNRISNLNMQRRDKGFTVAEVLDNEYKKLLRKSIKKNRIKTDYPIDLHTVERIIITPNAKGYISTFFLEFAKAHNIPIYWVDARGKIEASFMPNWFVKPMLVVKQCEARSNGKGLEIAKYLIKLKFESQKMQEYIQYLNKIKTIQKLVSLEGMVARKYFDSWEFSKEWHWNTRRGRNSYKNTNAVDGINTMLNFGYGLLAQKMSEILLGRGFELSIAFFHNDAMDRYWNMLAYDFIEPYRVWIDNTVKEMVAEREIKPNDFTYTEDKSYMVLRDKALKIAVERFIEMLEPLEHKSLPIIRNVENML